MKIPWAVDWGSFCVASVVKTNLIALFSKCFFIKDLKPVPLPAFVLHGSSPHLHSWGELVLLSHDLTIWKSGPVRWLPPPPNGSWRTLTTPHFALFTKEANLMHLSLEISTPLRRGDVGHTWGFVLKCLGDLTAPRGWFTLDTSYIIWGLDSSPKHMPCV